MKNLFIYLFIYFGGVVINCFLVLCSINVPTQLSPFPHHHFPLPYPRQPPTLNPTPPWLCPWVPHSCSFTSLSLLSHVISLSPPLWLLSVCCQFQCLWLYFVCQFILLIKNLKERQLNTSIDIKRIERFFKNEK